MGDDFDGPDKGGNDTAHVPYQPPENPQPIVRAPDGSERPYPGEPERPEEQHLPEEKEPDPEPEPVEGD